VKDIVIGGVRVGPTEPPFVVAELSGNHNGSLGRALEIVDAAADAGAHALKLQTYTADTLTIDVSEREFVIGEPSPWAGRSLYDLYREAGTPWEWHEPIARRCGERGLVWFSTPFDGTSLAFLEGLGAPCYKIASFEVVHLPLVRAVAATGKPVVMSTGMATLQEIGDAVQAAREAGCRDLILMKCTSTYPASPADSDLRTIPHMAEAFGCQVGLSDHTAGIGVAIAAVALGATVVEKHVTMDRADGGVDAAFSLEPAELRALVEETRSAAEALGCVRYGPHERELGSVALRRSLYITEDVAAGEVLTERNLRVIRPGAGLPPRFYETLLGRRVTRDVKRGTPASWDLV
jgi:pseudaminic acid synthase